MAMTTTFGTLEAACELEASGLNAARRKPSPKECVAPPPRRRDEIATKADLAEFKTEIQAELAKFKNVVQSKLTEFENGIHAGLASLDSRIQADITGLGGEARNRSFKMRFIGGIMMATKMFGLFAAAAETLS